MTRSGVDETKSSERVKNENSSRVPAAHQTLCNQPDAVHQVRSTDGQQLARCALWWQHSPPWSGQRLGLIGEFTAQNSQSGNQLLDEACAQLAGHGCTLAVGPINGSTWRGYRFVTEPGCEAPFFLEPTNPPESPDQFLQAGFSPLAGYCSAMVDGLDYESPKAVRAGVRLKAMGISIQCLDLLHWEEWLREAYRLTATCFQGSFLYQPLPESDFLCLYEQLRSCIQPELVLFAIRQGRPVGFAFNIPDVLQARRGEPVDTVILKTLAALPGREYAGLGWYLTQQSHRIARRLGYRRVIHALMHETNVSVNISAHYGRVFRRYALFSKPL